ncbi:hypothetical protein A2V82_15520 [candidate division KSB1 bacterium RBG_16_48_16]|nr:MAG: hypothetical protein A2V82_15520 [candidate division KSB1 bacterium RBG_16_48_16]
MRKSLYIFFVLVVGWLMTVGLTCEKRNVEVPVLNSAATPIEVNTSNNGYSEDGVYDAYDDVDQIREDNDFLEILSVHLESLTFKVVENSSAANTKISGWIQVSESSDGPFKNVIEINDLDLASVLNVEQKPDLNAEGVAEIDAALSPLIGGISKLASKKIYFRIEGTASPAPPPNVHFKIEVKVYLTVVGVVEVDVPA